jgi:protein-S-isoprenylcysteine O-methyltransferase Ste14
MLLFLKNLCFTLLVPGTVAVIIPLYAFSRPELVFSGLALTGAFLLLVGGVIYLWCLWDFASTGRGTPAPIDPPKTLVVRGLYAHSRNPMYVGVVSAIFGWALLFGSSPIAIYGGCVAAGFHLRVRWYEEPHLRNAFGSSYEQYCRDVSRWLPFRLK